MIIIQWRVGLFVCIAFVFVLQYHWSQFIIDTFIIQVLAFLFVMINQTEWLLLSILQQLALQTRTEIVGRWKVCWPYGRFVQMKFGIITFCHLLSIVGQDKSKNLLHQNLLLWVK